MYVLVMCLLMISRGACLHATIQHSTVMCLLATVGGLKLDSLAEAEAQTKDSSLLRSDRFPFQYVLFGHVPKTGGTSMRSILQTLSGSRHQSVQVCYNDVACSASVNGKLSTLPHITKFTRQDSTNQIVYGHGVQEDFATHWGLDGSHAARVIMMRDPIHLIASRYHHGVRAKTPGFHGVSFDDFVHGDMCENVILNYVHFVLADFGPADMAHLTSLINYLQGVRNSTNVLFLRTENYKASVNRLARFLGASPSEEQQLPLPTLNAASKEYELELKKSSFARLQTMCKPLQLVYDLAVEQEGQADSLDTAERALQASEVRIQNDIARLTIRSPTFVEEEY